LGGDPIAVTVDFPFKYMHVVSCSTSIGAMSSVRRVFRRVRATSQPVALKNAKVGLAPGLTPRAVLDKLAGIQMLDIYFPTTDGRKLRFRRDTKPERDQAILLARLQLKLPPQPPPEITTDHRLTIG
jgi:hypothetical protein